MSIHNDGWQKQSSIARNIAEHGQQTSKQDAKAEKSQASKLLQALQGQTKVPDAASTASTAEAARQPVQAGKDVPQALQKTRAEMQDQAARHDRTANKEYVDAKKSAADLQTKVIKTPDTAVADAVKQKGQVDQTHVQKQNPQQPGANVVAQAARQTPQAQAKKTADASRAPEKGKDGAEIKRGPDGQELPAQAAKTPGAEAQGAGAAAAASTFKLADAASERAAVGEGRESDSAPEEEGGEKRPASRSGAGVSASGSGKAREFNALLGGHAGSGGSEGQDPGGKEGLVPVEEGARAPEAEALLERDTGFRVYSEFDELAPGVERVKCEAQRFCKFVEKRLVEIAKLDSDLDLAIVSASQKIIVAPGSDPGLVQAVKDGIFQRKSVYGGMIG